MTAYKKDYGNRIKVTDTTYPRNLVTILGLSKKPMWRVEVAMGNAVRHVDGGYLESKFLCKGSTAVINNEDRQLVKEKMGIPWKHTERVPALAGMLVAGPVISNLHSSCKIGDTPWSSFEFEGEEVEFFINYQLEQNDETIELRGNHEVILRYADALAKGLLSRSTSAPTSDRVKFHESLRRRKDNNPEFCESEQPDEVVQSRPRG